MLKIIFFFFFLISKVTYADDFSDCKGTNVGQFTDCKSFVKYSSGASYEGIFKNGLFNGIGKFKYVNGDIYEGNFLNGLKEGYGKIDFNNGSKFEGEFKADKQEGFGRYFYENGDIYEGEYTNGKPTGKAKLSFHTGNYIEGNFVNGKADGEAIYFKEGKTYSTIFKEGKAGVLVEDKAKNQFNEDKDRESKLANNLPLWNKYKNTEEFDNKLNEKFLPLMKAKADLLLNDCKNLQENIEKFTSEFRSEAFLNKSCQDILGNYSFKNANDYEALNNSCQFTIRDKLINKVIPNNISQQCNEKINKQREREMVIQRQEARNQAAKKLAYLSQNRSLNSSQYNIGIVCSYPISGGMAAQLVSTWIVHLANPYALETMMRSDSGKYCSLRNGRPSVDAIKRARLITIDSHSAYYVLDNDPVAIGIIGPAPQ
jgi:hypothetical protein